MSKDTLTTQQVKDIVAKGQGTIEVGPSTHPNSSWNTLHIGDEKYTVYGSSPNWIKEQ